MTSYERRVKRLRDRVLANEKKAAEKNKPAEPTNKELMAMLDELGVEYDKKANKTTLLELLEKVQNEGSSEEENNDEGAE